MNRISLDIGPYWEMRLGGGPLVGVALHAGHNLRSEIVPLLAIDEAQRFREEDPYCDFWTQVCSNQVLTIRSRFEVDLNRSRDQAIYRTAEESWGIRVWRNPPDQSVISESLAEHDRFYESLEKALRNIEKHCGRFVVLDFHSYNHRREGPDAPPAEPELNPEINIGTGSMNRPLWAGVVDGFMDAVRKFDFMGRHLDIRENVNFRGRYLAQFVHDRFPESGCVLAVEVKKFFMDEWTGMADIRQVAGLREAFRQGASRILSEVD